MDYVRVGTIVNTFGIKGELKVKSLTDFPEIRFKANQVLYILYNKKYEVVTVKSFREHKGFILLLLKNLENINLVEKYKNCDIFISKDDVHTLSKGQYYFFELTGCNVYYNDECIGRVAAVDEGYQSVLRVKTKDKEVLIPYVERFIKEVNVDNKTIKIDVIEGML